MSKFKLSDYIKTYTKEEPQNKNIKESVDFELDFPEEISVEQENLFDGYLGEQREVPNPLEYGPNATYRNLREGIVYKKGPDNLWETFVKDGIPGKQGAAGGSGTGVEEVKRISTTIATSIVTSAILNISASTSGSTFIDPIRVFVDDFGAIGNGVVNDYMAISAALSSCPENAVLVFGLNKIYNVSGTFNINKTLNIDGNNSTIKSNNQIILAKPQRSQFVSNNYFSLVEGSVSFVSSAISFSIGDIVRFESNKLRVLSATYYFGETVKIVGVSGTTYYVEKPFMGSYVVDRIYINNSKTVHVNNLNFDFRQTTKRFDENIYHINIQGYSSIEFTNCELFGGKGSGVGFFCGGYIVRFDNCYVSDVEDYLDAASENLILGYGYSLYGDDVTITNCIGYNCKHIVDSEDRYAVTRNFRVVGGSYTTNPDRYNDTILIGGSTVPLKQYCVGTHGNVKNFYISDCYIDGCNDIVAVRCGNLQMTNSVLVGRNYTNGYHHLIRLNEYPIENVLISNTKVIIPNDNSVSGERCLFGIFNLESTNKNIIVDNVTFDGGYFGYVHRGTYQFIDIDNIIFRNITGKVFGGFNFTNTKTNNSRLGSLIIENCNITLDNSTGNTTPFLNMYASKNIDNLYFNNNNVNYTSAKNTSKFLIIYDCGVSAIFIKNNNIKCDYTAIEYRQVNVTSPSKIEICGNIIEYFNGTSGTNYSPGIFLDIYSNNTNMYNLDGNNVKIINTSAHVDASPIRITSAGFFKLTNNELNRTWFYTNSNIDKLFPSGNINISGSMLWKGATEIDYNGKMKKTSIPTSAGTFYQGDVVYNSSVTSAGPLGWLCVTSGTPGTWVNLNI